MLPLSPSLLGYAHAIDKNSKSESINLSSLSEPIHLTENHIICTDQEGKVEHVVSRRCDHAGGKLMERNGKLICPLHLWEWDPKTKKYTNGVCKPSLNFQISNDAMVVEDADEKLEVPFSTQSDAEVTFRFLAHASVAITCAGVTIVTDPWLIGPCFNLGWWHKFPPKDDALKIIAQADVIYISHNHPDHLHEETLRHVPRDKLIVTADFVSRSCESMLKNMGFTNVHALPFNACYKVDVMEISILQAGDFRDDSGLLLKVGGTTFLFTVDSNALNNWVLPDAIDVLLTSFSGGASGYPLTWDIYSEDEKRTRINKALKAYQLQVKEYINRCNPHVYIPYAGYFTETEVLDTYIYENNKKNSPDLMKRILSQYDSLSVISPIEFDEVTFLGGAVVAKSNVSKPLLYELNRDYVEGYLASYEQRYANFNIHELDDFFSKQTFRDDLLLYIQLTDQNFVTVAGSALVDFRENRIRYFSSFDELKSHYDESSEARKLLMKTRTLSFAHVIRNCLPWEDLSIGFQCRFERKPDIYNTNFWYYFTNEVKSLV